jgi:hypothetical protein
MSVAQYILYVKPIATMTPEERLLCRIARQSQMPKDIDRAVEAIQSGELTKIAEERIGQGTASLVLKGRAFERGFDRFTNVLVFDINGLKYVEYDGEI